MEGIFSKTLASVEPRSRAHGVGSGLEASVGGGQAKRSAMMTSTDKIDVRKFSPPDLVRVTVGDEETFRQKQLDADGTWEDSYSMYIGQIGVVTKNREGGMCDVLFVHGIELEADARQLVGVVGTTEDEKKIAFVSLQLHEKCLGRCLAACWFPGDMAVVFPHPQFLLMTNGQLADFTLLDQWAGRLVMVEAVTDGIISVKSVEDKDDIDSIELSPPSLVPVLICSSATQQIVRWRNNTVEIPFASIFKNRTPKPDDLRSLYNSIQSHDVAGVEHFVKRFIGAVDVAFGETGETALMYAINANNLSVVNLLLQAGASPRQTNAAGTPAFHFFFERPACQLGSLDILERLIERCGRRLNEVVDGNLRTLLHMAVENKHSVALGRLLECADLDVNAQDAVLRTPLHYVADSKEGDSKLLSIGSQLLSCGADVLIVDSNCFTPLHYCAMHGNRKLLVEMLETSAYLPSGDVEKPNDGWTPLHFAAVNGHVSVVEELIGNEWCNVDARTSDDQSIFHLMHSVLQSQLYKRLKPGQPHSDVLSCSLFQVYESLVRFGANLNVYTENHGTPLHFAFQQLCLAIASSGGKQPDSTLIARLYAVDESAKEISLTNNLLPICAAWPQLAVVCFLLCKGASVMQKTPQDMTVFEMAPLNLRCLIFYFHKLYSCLRDDRNRMRTLCLFCDSRSNVVYLKPCQHLAPFCDECANRDAALALPKCPTCRERIVDRIDLDGKSIERVGACATEDDQARLKKLKEIEERLACPICLDNEKNIRLNCEHFLCEDCSQRVIQCPVCRIPITSRTKTFI